MTCQIRNFSRSGIGIEIGQDVPCGKIVKVQWDDHFLIGRVQRVDGAGTSFQVGIELLYCTQWHEPMTYLLASAGARPLERYP